MKTRNRARLLLEINNINRMTVGIEELRGMARFIDIEFSKAENYKNWQIDEVETDYFIKCSCDQWEGREVITFNRDGFVGFAGWASDENIQPILNGLWNYIESLEVPE